MSDRPKIGLVIHRYGEQISGGSESHARQVAERLITRYDVEVLTTCAVDHMSWKNVLPAGETTLNGVRIRRFPVKQDRDHWGFHAIYDRLFAENLTAEEEHTMLRLQGPYCPRLVEHIAAHSEHYDAFLFFTYLYYPTVAGLPLVKRKSAFVPTAHNEKSLYFHVLDDLFTDPPVLLFNSEEEQQLLERRFNLQPGAGRIVGLGVDEPEAGPEDPQWQELAERLAGRPVLTYVGRIESGKGCHELVDHFVNFTREQNREDVILLLLGKSTMKIPVHGQIIAPGYVSEYVKHQALACTTVAITPSPLESLCMAALEAWMHRRPLLVNGQCPVLVGHCLRSNGGLWYGGYSEFRETLKLLLGDERLRQRLGEQGRRYVEDRYRWDVVDRAYFEILDGLIAKRPAVA